MKNPITYFVCALALALPASSWAQSGGSGGGPGRGPRGAFADAESAYNYGVNIARYFTSTVYNTTDCNPALVDNAETRLALVIETTAGLTTRDSRLHRANYYMGIFAGVRDQTIEEYRDCMESPAATRPTVASRFRKVPLRVLARAACAAFNLMVEDLGGELVEFESFIVESLTLDPITLRSVGGRHRLSCQNTFFNNLFEDALAEEFADIVDAATDAICR